MAELEIMEEGVVEKMQSLQLRLRRQLEQLDGAIAQAEAVSDLPHGCAARLKAGTQVVLCGLVAMIALLLLAEPLLDFVSPQRDAAATGRERPPPPCRK